MAKGGVRPDMLFVGLTRPALLFGVSYTFAILNGFVGMMGYIIASDIKFMVMIVPIHFIGYALCSKEPLFIELWKVKAEKCGTCRNRLFHGGNSYDPF